MTDPFDIEKMRSMFSEEITKAVTTLKGDLKGEIVKDIEDRLVNVGEELSKNFDDLSGRLNKVEKVSGTSQGLRGTEAAVEKGKKGNVFSGLFTPAIEKAQARM